MIILFDEDETVRYNGSEMFGKWSMYEIPIMERHIETTANRFFNKRELVNATFIASNWTHPYNKEGMEKWMQGKFVAITLFDYTDFLHAEYGLPQVDYVVFESDYIGGN